MVKAKKKHSKTFFEKLEGEIITEAEDYLNYKTEKVKKKLISLSEVSVLVILGFFLISFGMAAVLENYVPLLSGGFGYLTLGILFLIVSSLIRL